MRLSLIFRPMNTCFLSASILLLSLRRDLSIMVEELAGSGRLPKSFQSGGHFLREYLIHYSINLLHVLSWLTGICRWYGRYHNASKK